MPGVGEHLATLTVENSSNERLDGLLRLPEIGPNRIKNSWWLCV
jgi:hypothetical protein